jgi:hypothetical protein
MKMSEASERFSFKRMSGIDILKFTLFQYK